MEQKLTQTQIKNNVANEIVTTGLQEQVGTAIANKNISDKILAQFNELAEQGQLVFPKNYNVGNALKLAYSTIVNNNLQICEPLSIANALSEYVIQGLDVSKKQAYFINYGGKLSMQRSYFGDVTVCKRTGVVKEVFANVIYEGDKFEMGYGEDGREEIKLHETSFLNKDNKILGAYAVATGENGKKLYCIMTMKEIETSWSMAKSKQSTFRDNFKQEACKRTVIRRLVKMFFNTVVEDIDEYADAVIASYNRSTEEEFDNSQERKYQTQEQVKDVIEVNVGNETVENPFNENTGEVVEEKVEPTPKVEVKEEKGLFDYED